MIAIAILGVCLARKRGNRNDHEQLECKACVVCLLLCSGLSFTATRGLAPVNAIASDMASVRVDSAPPLLGSQQYGALPAPTSEYALMPSSATSTNYGAPNNGIFCRIDLFENDVMCLFFGSGAKLGLRCSANAEQRVDTRRHVDRFEPVCQRGATSRLRGLSPTPARCARRCAVFIVLLTKRYGRAAAEMDYKEANFVSIHELDAAPTMADDNIEKR